MTERIRAYDRQIEDLCQSRYPETKGLRQVGGVGVLTSLAYILSLEDPARFRKSREVGPFLGMVPRQNQSGGADPQLRITPGLARQGRQDRRRLLAAATLDCPPSLPWQSRGQAGGQRPVHPRALRSRLPVPGTGATCAAGD
jgi:transposase